MTPPEASSPKEAATVSPHARLILAVLFAVSMLNFIDRQILSTLQRDIKADLMISDARIAFLYGTAFVTFYITFGIPLGVYADLGSRRKLLAWGLGLWSLMTALSGLATGFPALALARVGVGVGEASASPAAYSLIADLFPKARRATALAIYSLGVYVGIGLSSYLGGAVVDRWRAAFPPGLEPFGLHGWQVAFLVAGLPGLVLVPLVLAFREPARGATEGVSGAALERSTGSDAQPGAARIALLEGLGVLPPFSFFVLRRDKVPLGTNLKTFALLAAFTAGLWLVFGDLLQWACLSLGLYVVATMAQRLKVREPDAFALIFNTPSLRWGTLAFSCLSFTGYAISLWTLEFFRRYHGFSLSEIGARLGVISAIGGGLGVTMGGALADWLRRTRAEGRLMVGMMNAVIPIPFLFLTFDAPDRNTALMLFAVAQFFAALWLGAGSSMVQDLVLPHMRARASAVFLLFVNLIGLGLGPYFVGRLSVRWHDLRLAFMAATLGYVVAFVLFVLAGRTIAKDEETRFARATAARA